MIRYFLGLLFFVFLSGFGLAQNSDSLSKVQNLKQISIDTASVMIGQQVGTKYIQTLVHNVILRHEGSVMTCDSAILDEANQFFKAYGNVNITEADGTSLSSKYIYYNGKTKSVKATGDVVLVESMNTLYANALDYNLKTKKGYYRDGGVLETEDTKLWSDIGEYDGISHWSHFKGHVIIENLDYHVQSKELDYNTETKIVKFNDYSEITKDQSLMITHGGTYNSVTKFADFDQPSTVYNENQTIKADRLKYDKENGIAFAKGKVRVEDTTQHSILYANEAYYYDAAKQMLAYGKPVLVRYNLDKKDSTFLLADTLRSVSIMTGVIYRVSKDSLGQETVNADTTYKRNFIAWNNVRFQTDSMQSICDSMYFSETDSVIRYYKKPILWSNDRQMKGDTIYAFMRSSNKLDSLILLENSSVMSGVPEIPDAMDQILGERIFAYFNNGDINLVQVFKNAQCIYYIKNENKEFIGAHESESQRIDILFDKDEIDKVKLYQDINGKEHPMDKIDFKKLKFEGSVWYSELRPTDKKEYYNRIHFTDGVKKSTEFNSTSKKKSTKKKSSK